MTWLNQCHFGDVRDVLRQMIADGVKVDTIITSPPYWGLRSYLPDDHPDKAREIGSEPTLREFIATMTEVMMLAREVLADDGTMWMNMGDCYATGAGKVNTAPGGGTQGERWAGVRTEERSGYEGKHNYRVGPMTQANRMPQPGLKPKDLAGQPWRLAFALQDAGWWLRQDIIWHKPNPMPESTQDRCTKAHEYIFLLSKSERYYFDQEAILEPVSPGTHARLSQNVQDQVGSDRINASGQVKTNGNMKAVGRTPATPSGWATGTDRKHDEVLGRYSEHRKAVPRGVGFGHGTDADARGRGRVKNNDSFDDAMAVMPTMRNKRSVWTIPTQSYKGSHFATFPEKLVEPCILAGSRVGGTVLDIFFGSGTTGQVAQRLGRNFIGIDINRANKPLQDERLQHGPGLQLEAA